MAEKKTAETKPERKAAAPKAPKSEPLVPVTSLGGHVETDTATKASNAPKPAKGGWWWGTGRRKRAVARVRIRPAKSGGEGKVIINLAGEKTKTIEQYFAEDRDRASCYAPLKATNTLGKVEVYARLNGGGYMGQAGAFMMGLARCLKDYDPALEATLRASGMLSRDAREVERKKYGQAGARRRFQFSKR